MLLHVYGLMKMLESPFHDTICEVLLRMKHVLLCWFVRNSVWLNDVCLLRIKPPAPCKSSSGIYSSMAVMVVHNGKDKNHAVDNVGTVPAALTSYLAIQAFKPDLVISAGTAGGFKEKVTCEPCFDDPSRV